MRPLGAATYEHMRQLEQRLDSHLAIIGELREAVFSLDRAVLALIHDADAEGAAVLTEYQREAAERRRRTKKAAGSSGRATKIRGIVIGANTA